MEFEKTLFRVHEKILSSKFAKKSIHACFYLYFLIALIILPLFIYANIHYRDFRPCLNYMVDNYNRTDKSTPLVELLKSDSIAYIKIVSLTEDEIKARAANNTPINESETLQFFQYAGNYQVLNMNATVRRQHNFNEVNLTLPLSCYAGSSFEKFLVVWFFDLETIFVNEVLTTFKGNDCYVKNNKTDEIWTWTAANLKSYEYQGVFQTILNRLAALIKLTFGYFLVSSITAIYIKITIICAPIFILIIYSCCSSIGNPDQTARLSVYRAFPWIGIYLYAQLANGQRKQWHIVFAFLCLVVVFYCLYLSSIFIWNLLLFYKSIPRGLDENFYGFIALLEFLTLLFIRTRSSIKWFPRISFIMVLSFLLYVQFIAYGFLAIGLYLLIATLMAVFAYHLITFEIPAIEWNPFHHYAPSVDSPRTLFFPAFSLSWYHDLPQLWTMFYPLFGRSRFTQAQLALVDRNDILLNQTLEQAFQRGQNLHEDAPEEQANNGPVANNQPPANNEIEFSSNAVVNNAGTSDRPQERAPLNDSGSGISLDINDAPISQQSLQQPLLNRRANDENNRVNEH